jgi:hypothetical protein
MIKIAISSVKKYSDYTLPIIIPSLLESGIPREDIYIFEGGYDERTVENYNGITHIKVAHNSFDYTALIDIVENNLESEYWFLIHDTCKVGPKFAELVSKIPEGEPDVICMLGAVPGTMNICSYKYTYLKEKYDQIVSLKNTDYTEQGLLKAKEVAANAENTLQIGSILYNPELFSDILFERQPSQYLNNGVNRNVRYFGNLDVYKYQANYGQWPWVVDL